MMSGTTEESAILFPSWPQDSFIELYGVVLLRLLLLYFGFCLAVDVACQWVGHYDKIQPRKQRSWALLASECFWSVVCIVIGAVFVAVCIRAGQRGGSKLYWDVAEYGYVFWVMQFVGTWLGNDAWQYWTHRFLHEPFIYQYAHKVHHRFFAPSAFATMSFHPIEAVVQFLPSLATLLFPVHIPSLLFSSACFFTISVVEHCGHTITWLERFSSFFCLSSPFHHDRHHQILRANYAVYFTFWDSLCDTKDNAH